MTAGVVFYLLSYFCHGPFLHSRSISRFRRHLNVGSREGTVNRDVHRTSCVRSEVNSFFVFDRHSASFSFVIRFSRRSSRLLLFSFSLQY